MSDISMADPAPENSQAQADDQSTEADGMGDRGLPFPKVAHGKVEVQHLDMYVNHAVYYFSFTYARLILAVAITVTAWTNRRCKIGVAPTDYRAQEQRTS